MALGAGSRGLLVLLTQAADAMLCELGRGRAAAEAGRRYHELPTEAASASIYLGSAVV